MTDPTNDGDVRTLLEEERTRLQQIRASLSTERVAGGGESRVAAEPPYADDRPDESDVESIERDRDLSILEHVDAQLADVDRAMERLEHGTYGICEACGRPIDPDRLRARPAARLCIEDQAKEEERR